MLKGRMTCFGTDFTTHGPAFGLPLVLAFLTLCSLFFAPASGRCFAGEDTTINADSLEFIQETATYVAKGSVKIHKANALIEADAITYNEASSEAVATGNVRYEDPDYSFTASRAELNLTAKTGLLYDARIFYKKDNYHISGKVIEKKSEKEYVIPEALLTTCDAPVPAWCFKGKNVDAQIGDRFAARNVTFRIKDIPVLYTPYLYAPVQADRKTGLLMPFIGYSNQKGVYADIPFFWAISENSDATISLDGYSKRGVGEGLEYRYIYPGDIKGKWWVYHIWDTELSKDFLEIKAVHNQRSADSIGGFLNVNFINEKDFYREYQTNLEVRTNRFLESTGEINVPFSTSRAYLLSQYWIDLTENSISPAERLPEAGYVLNPLNIGGFWLSGTATASNFWSDGGTDGRRLDFYPRISYKAGKDITLIQTLGLRETAYLLDKGDEDSLHRESLEYSAGVGARLQKKYNSFTHVIEPALRYSLITNSENNTPVFDSADIFEKQSLFELALLNRFIDNKGEFMVVRIAQGFDSLKGDRPFLPLHLEIGIKRPLSMRLETLYDVHTGQVESVNSELSMAFPVATVSAGQRYNRLESIKYYTAGLGLGLLKPFYLDSRVWYDAITHEVREVSANIRYVAQCWAVNLGIVNRPDDFNISFMFELKGLTKPLQVN
jgi:LPS-assembly protein